ncbi:MaoC family dehydratase [Mycobacterium sp. CBMA293]|uniref:MaoC family dehydratase N-terminal domain-containing protein n=1 Tax=unclassified Mycolicibacterium TaxID=2636767 RepID=UPI0013247225|nr:MULTISPECIES: MaoC family dehydratase N-terminal domain-containing protein [unclassified Mycolicibacterium]MUL44924.1 MaoC family dehydratase [Mycolicibacterium sp. CBMA 360]MUL95517.1 MaoC family dehydratase [Mycolicibacterium sp. CBMA 230]MUL57967.1 MaoC family dehydratase [Mycolicibacterium sp. CBMA 335]MUL73425.1 MaoC family dehydratase [Mycolicibacterium sp. CBMA 311]MUM07398.1 acyl dehydratase [Mycolicibacterium sp. CBMA 213]
MAIDTSAIGTELPPQSLTIDRGRLRFFAKAIGETDPVYTEVDAAKAAGYQDLPAPPTFLFSVELENPDPFVFLSSLGVDLRFVLHGEQSFTYHQIAYPGDELVARPRIVDIYSKKGGALEFVVKETAITRTDGTPIADLRSVIVVQNPGVTA